MIEREGDVATELLEQPHLRPVEGAGFGRQQYQAADSPDTMSGNAASPRTPLASRASDRESVSSALERSSATAGCFDAIAAATRGCAPTSRLSARAPSSDNNSPAT